ncbi:MAG: TetR/AcrR family transcriptional regulator [Pseudonocardia sp.]|nr:TetR/AcrR family transcriptional regulator [Pseudonocardia sp.]
MVENEPRVGTEPQRQTLRARNKLRTRRALLDAALEVFTEQGYGSATVEAIAARAGASKVTIYNYFPQGREELFRELYEDINTELLEEATAAWERGTDPVARITDLARILLQIGTRPLVGRFYSISDPALEAALDPVRGHASGVFAKMITSELAAVRSAGGLRSHADPEALAQLLVGATRVALTDASRRPDRSEELLTAFADLVRGLLDRRPGPGA